MTIRKFPAQATRVETGSVQFGDDWPGLFIRGDNAAFYALNLKRALELLPDDEMFTRSALEGLMNDLFSTEVK